jgi:hypothetical protein
MVILDKVIWDIRHVLKALKDDSRISDYHLMDLIAQGRAGLIVERYRKERTLDPQWSQTFRDETLTQVAAGDIPDYAGFTTYKFGKITYPGIVSGPVPEFGVISFGSTSNWKRFYKTTWDQLKLMIDVNDLSLQSFNYYIHQEDAFYVFNYFGNVTAVLILNDPLEGYRYRTEYVLSGKIQANESYYVESGTVGYNNVSIVKGGTFIGIEDYPDYLGVAKVTYLNKRKKLTSADPYPMDAPMAREIILSILTKEFQIERQSIMDVINDSADTLELLKGALTR